MPRLVQHAVDAAAPFLTVPSHVMVSAAGEFQGVNYDHCVLGLRASRRLLPYLSSEHQMLSMAQAIWYMPQGLDVWDQLLCEFPGHYARDDKKCGLRPGGTDDAGQRPLRRPGLERADAVVPDRPRARPGGDDRVSACTRLQTRIMEGDKSGAYKVALGLHAGARGGRAQGARSRSCCSAPSSTSRTPCSSASCRTSGTRRCAPGRWSPWPSWSAGRTPSRCCTASCRTSPASPASTPCSTSPPRCSGRASRATCTPSSGATGGR